MSDERALAALAGGFQQMGADTAQARVMAIQLLKRARQLAQERGVTAEAALAELLAKVTAGRRGDYPPQ